MNHLAQPLIDLPAAPAVAPGCRRLRRVVPGRVAAVALAGLLAAACGGTDRDFEAAQRSNTQSGWEDYLRQHPQGEHARAAQQRLAQLVEAREWERARSADTIDAYQQYLRGYPQGAHAADATSAVANLNLAATPTVEATMPPPRRSVTQPAVPAAKATQAAKAAPATPAMAATKAAPAVQAAPARQAAAQGFRVQLGAYAMGSAAASAAWQALLAHYPELREHEPIIAAARAADGRAIHRLQVAGFDRAGATALCRKLTADRHPCLLVPSRRAAAARSQPG